MKQNTIKNNYNNSINDGIAYGDDEILVYNENRHLHVERFKTKQLLELPYDGYFITRYHSKVVFADKKRGFVLCAFDLGASKEEVLLDKDVRWVVCVGDNCFFTCGDDNFLWRYDLLTQTSELVYKSSCNYLCYGGDKIFFSNWEDNKYLYSYNIKKGTIALEYAMNCAWINYVKEECVLFRNWNNGKTYFINLETREFRVMNTDESNYLLYHQGYIFYSNIRQGGLWQQSILDKKDKKQLLTGSFKRLNIVKDCLYCVNDKKELTKHKIIL